MVDQPAPQDAQSNKEESAYNSPEVLSVNRNETDSQPESSNENKGNTNGKRRLVKDRPKWTDVAIVFLTLGIVFLAFMQWREMVGAGQQTSDLISAARIQAQAATNFSKSASDIQATIGRAQSNMQTMAESSQQAQRQMNSQIEIVQKQFRLDQRPIVWFANANTLTGQQNPVISIDKVAGPEQKERLAINVYFTNLGKGPAMEVTSDEGIATGTDAVNRLRFSKSAFGNQFFPNGIIEFTTVFSDAMPDEEVTRIMNMDGGIAFKIRFRYKDSLQYQYESDLCLARYKTSAWWFCTPTGIKDCSAKKCG